MKFNNSLRRHNNVLERICRPTLASFLLSLTFLSLAYGQDTLPNAVYVAKADRFTITNNSGATGLDNGDTVTWMGSNSNTANLTFGTDAYISIQDAINGVAADGTVYIAAGSYDEGSELSIILPIILQGDGAELTVLSGGSDGDADLEENEHRILNITTTAGNVELHDLSFVDGIAAIDVTDGEEGGAVFFEGKNLHIDNCTFERNLATGDGGAVYFDEYAFVDGTFTISNTNISENMSSSGAGIYVRDGAITMNDCELNSNNSTNNGGALYLRGGSAVLNGSTLSDNTSLSFGGAIYQFTASLSLSHMTIENNIGSSGGGIYSRNTLTMDHVDFIANEATASGGGLYNFSNTCNLQHVNFTSNIAVEEGGGLANRGELTASYLTFTRNSVLDGDGGGVSNRDSFIANDLSFTGNSVTDGDGGGISNRDIMTLTNLTVLNNTALVSEPRPFAARANGGGIANNSTFGMLTVTGADISGNTSSDSGGGVYNFFGGVTMSNTLISNNLAEYEGGGMSISGALLDLTGCIISGNTAVGDGGGIKSSSDIIRIHHCTVTNNASQGNGGGIYFNAGSDDIVTVSNTVIAGNTDEGFSNLGGDTYGNYTAQGVNFIGVENNNFDGFRPGTDLSFSNTSATTVDDLFTPLSDNGGPYHSHAIVPNSPLLDVLPSGDLDSDFRGNGFVREYGSAVDIGALELFDRGADPELYIKEAIAGEDVLLEAKLVPGQRYAIEYSDNLAGYTRIPFTITAQSNTYQLRDIGAPLTVSPSSTATKRFYRLIINPDE